jgi:hypothetical protein
MTVKPNESWRLASGAGETGTLYTPSCRVLGDGELEAYVNWAGINIASRYLHHCL